MTEPQALLRYRAAIEEALRAIFSRYSLPLYHLMEYQLGWRDDRGAPLETPLPQTRLYASLCLLACEALGGDYRRALPAATAVELVSQFAQLHADIQDGSQQRYNRPTVWWIWGPAQAINAGDGLHALGRLALTGIERQGVPPTEALRFVERLDAACLRMCEGLHQELVYQERVDIAPDAYLNMARQKVGALVGCALELGAMSAGVGVAGEVLRQFGEDVGVAFQIQEDIQMLWGEPLMGKPRGLDLLNKKKGLPVLLALEQAPPAQKRELGTLFFKRVLEPPDAELVSTILDRLGARDRAEEAGQGLLDGAVRHLERVGVTAVARGDLARVARWLALRKETS